MVGKPTEGQKAVVLTYQPISDYQKANVFRIKTLIAQVYDELVEMEKLSQIHPEDARLAQEMLVNASMRAVRGITNL